MNRRALLAVGALALAFLGGWEIASWRHDAEMLKAAKKAAGELTAMTAKRDAVADDLRKASDQHEKKLSEAQDETNRLRDRLRSGALGLRVAAKCPAASPQAPAAPGVDTGAGAELAGAAESAYFALRDGIDRAGAQLAACQAELRLRVD